jgi:translation initiation factor 2B subunit (eIF-2B alpha/beta/delta family)
VSEWREWPSWRRLAAIARVPDQGAAAVGSLAAGAFIELVEGIAAYRPDAYPDAVFEIADEILERQPAMAPLITLVNAIHLSAGDGPGPLVAELRAVERRAARSAALLGQIGAGLIEPGASVLTVGGSGSVRAVLTEAGAHRRVFVSCVATMPSGEGVELAADLAGAGLPVEVVSDEEAVEAVGGVDLVMTGATAVGPEAFTNASGTADVIEAAVDHGLPRYLVVSIEKALPAPLFSRAVAARAGATDEVPLGLLTGVITELGPLDPRALGKLAAEREVAARLAE